MDGLVRVVGTCVSMFSLPGGGSYFFYFFLFFTIVASLGKYREYEDRSSGLIDIMLKFHLEKI